MIVCWGATRRHVELGAPINIYVGNLPYSYDSSTLESLFSPYGAVQSASVITDRETGRPRGFAFVTMPNDEEARNAIEQLNGQEFEGRTLNVNEARPKTGGLLEQPVEMVRAVAGLARQMVELRDRAARFDHPADFGDHIGVLPPCFRPIRPTPVDTPGPR